MTYKEKSQEIYEQFEHANSFKTQINLHKDIKRSVLFENGKQWNMDEDIAEFPKITLNIIKQIGKAKKSNIMQNEYGYLISSNNFKSVRKIQDFLKHLADSVDLRTKDLKSLTDDFIKGTAIGYFYWDAEKRGFMKKSGGHLRYENIDIRHFAVANPYIQSIQDQEWIIVVSREKINSLKEKYGKDKNIVSDGNLYTFDTEVEPTARTVDEELVNVYTKFYRNKEGQVFFIITTQFEILKNETPLNPYYKGSKKEMPNTTRLQDDKKDTDTRSEHVFDRYPFVRLCLNERDNNFYGLPVTLEYIESQKSINNHYSVYDKALQDNVLGGFVFRKGVLDETEITTENGQMIGLDMLPNENINNVFGRIPVANVPQDSYNYSQSLIGLTRQVAGASNIQLGMSDYAGQSGKQTQMLLQRAQENSSDTAMTFNEFKRDQAYIMFSFAKFFYDNEDFAIIEHGFKEDSVRDYTGPKKFDGTEYLEDDVRIDIKVGASPSFSEFTNIELMGLMVQSGQAPFEAYISLLPEGYVSNKQELLKLSQNNSLKQIEAMNKQMEQMQMVMQQMADAYKETQKDRANIDMVIQENERLKSMMAEVAANAIKRVNESSQTTNEMTKEIQNVLNVANKKNM
jgi:hypothetical protein